MTCLIFEIWNDNLILVVILVVIVLLLLLHLQLLVVVVLVLQGAEAGGGGGQFEAKNDEVIRRVAEMKQILQVSDIFLIF